MKLFKIWQDVNNDYDTYSDAVVIAADEEDAKKINPNNIDGFVPVKPSEYDSWCGIGDVQVEYLGEAKEGSKRSIVCASFHAG